MTVMSLLLGALLVGFALVVLGGFISWRSRVLTQLLRGSELAETAKGPVEFAMAGSGPVILQMHGGSSGYDQPLALSWDLHEAGFTILTPSRPGYLRTPLPTGDTPERAADALASLLDVLRIDKVGVIGTSGGGPTALQFALRHLIWVGPGAGQAARKVRAFLIRHARQAATETGPSI